MRFIGRKQTRSGHVVEASNRQIVRQATTAVVDALEPRRLFVASGEVPLGLNFNDEALWAEHFDEAVAEAKSLGVKAVRVWFDYKEYSERPTAYDVDPGSMVQEFTRPNGSKYQTTNPPGRVLKRLFQLKREGFNVMVTVQRADGVVPNNAAEVKGFFTHLMNTTETPGGSFKLKDAVDRWEIGNEPDIATYWKDAAPDKYAGFKSYVEKLLLPAAEVLHGGPRSEWETVVSAGVSFSVLHTKAIVNHAISLGKGDAIDMIGYHPYGTSSQQNARGPEAKKFADSVGKPLLATEWNVRGETGADEAKWAAANDNAYRNFNKASFETAYYFGLLNNYAARAGEARPASALEHVTTLGVTPSSTAAQKTAFYKTDLRRNEPFYSMLEKWQYGVVSGTTFNDADGSGTQNGSEAGTSRTVFIDVNDNGRLDSNEPSTVSAASGAFTLKYSVGQVDPGTYALRQSLPSGTAETTAAKIITVDNLRADAGVKLGSRGGTVTPPPVTTGSVSGTVFNDTDGNGIKSTGEAAISGRVIFIDLDNDNVFDANEPTGTSTPTGAYTIAYDTATLGTGTYTVAQTLPSQWEQTTVTQTVTLAANGTRTVNLGSRPVFVTPPVTTGTVTGTIFNDTDGNGVQGSGEGIVIDCLVWIDLDNDAVRDANEPAATSNGSGVYSITYDTTSTGTGTFALRQIIPSGWEQTTPARTVTLAANASATITLGSRPVVVTPPPPITGSVSGFMWSEIDGDGVREPGETAAGNRQVYLDANGNGRLDSGEKNQYTNSAGEFSFTDLAAGTYKVRRVLPTGYRLSAPLEGFVNVTLASGQNVVNIGLGSTDRALVGGMVFDDADKNGTQNNGEFGLAGAVVFVDVNKNNVLDASEQSVTTDSNGAWAFTGLKAGTYGIRLAAAEGRNQTLPAASGSLTLTIKAAQVVGSLKFGSALAVIVPPPVTTGFVSGTAFNDLDADGVLDTDEAGIAGRTVWLDLDNDSVFDSNEPSAVTDTVGAWKINYDTAVTPAGSYVLRQSVPSGYEATTVAPTIIVAGGRADAGVLVGSRQTPVTPPPPAGVGSISGYLFGDSNGNSVLDGTESIGGARKIFLDANNNNKIDTGERVITSTSAGYYTFSDLAPGDYIVRREGASGYRVTNLPDGARRVTIAAGDNVAGQNFGSTDKALLAGVVYDDIDRDGVRTGTEPGKTGFRVFLDSNNNGLFDGNEKNILTDLDGNWAFTDLTAGTYTARIEPQTGFDLLQNSNGLAVTVAKASMTVGRAFGVSPIVMPPPTSPLAQAIAKGWTRAASQFAKTLAFLNGDTTKFVDRTGPDGNWVTVNDRSWVSGMLGGSFWKLYANTGDATWKTAAENWTRALAPVATVEAGDNGFRFLPGYLPLIQSSQSAADKTVLLQAAATKDGTWNEAVGAYETRWYRSHSGNPNANYAVLIDQVNDLELLFWAANESGNASMAARATRHMETVIANLVRADGSTSQLGLFDKTTGAFHGLETFQGYSDTSAWSRGQAWALRSFTDVAARTGRTDFVDAAAKVANYFVDNLPADGVPFWDFSLPDTNGQPKDSSAAAIAASGLIKLSTVVTDAALKTKFKAAAEKILGALLSESYLAPVSAPAGLVLHGAGNVPNNAAVNDVSLIYGDFALLEAMERYRALPA